MLTTAQQVRLLVRDPLRRTGGYVYADGTATAFFVSGAPVYSGTDAPPSARLLLGAGALSATGATWDYDNGIVAFPTAVSANSGIFVDYSWSCISEAEMEFITAHYPSLEEMAMGALQVLMADHAKMVKWAVAQGPSVDPSIAQQALQDLWMLYNNRIITRHAEGGVESWSEQTQPAGGYFAGSIRGDTLSSDWY